MRGLLICLLIAPLGAQSLPMVCEPSAETTKLLEAVPPLRDALIPYEQRVGALRALAQKYPGDFFVQRAYQDSFRQERHLGEEFDRALAMYRGRKDDPLARYYEARLLMRSAPKQARATLTEMLAVDPGFAWPHLDLMEYAAFPGMRSEADSTAHSMAFAKACPEASIGGSPTSRAGLERRNSPLDATRWAELWQSEEKASRGAGFAERVRADLKRMDGWKLRSDPELLGVYREAARMLKDPEILKGFRKRVDDGAPRSLLALWFVQDDWEKAHPVPERNAPPAEWKQRQDAEILAYREWLKRWPNASQLLGRVVMDLGVRAEAGPFPLRDADLQILDAALRSREESPDGWGMYPPLETAVARIYTAGKTRLERVPGLLDAGLRRIEIMTKYDLSPDLFPSEPLAGRHSALRRSGLLQEKGNTFEPRVTGEMRSRTNDWRTITAVRTEEVRVDYLMATNRAGDARPLIEEALGKVDPSKADAGYQRTRWIERLARVDAAAAERYRKATADWRPPAAEAEFSKALPEFSAKDLAGRTWQLRDLKGKATFVNFWATWCGPCRGEHVGVQELHERAKERGDVQVLTFSVDDDADIARQYMNEKGYTFPVICGKEVADRLFPYAGLPTNFLVNPAGMRTGMRGFGGDSASVRALIEELTKAAKR